MKRLAVEIDLGTLRCHDEADKAGNAEPYMWTVFFKIDGTTCVFSDEALIRGKTTIRTSPGNHGNLVGGGGMDAGDSVRIPHAIGHWKTALIPIPSVESKKLKVGGALGVVVVALEEDETPHAAAAAGHKAFNEAMQRELDLLMPTFTIMNPEPTPEDIQTLSDKMSDAIIDAITEKVGVGEWFTGLFGGGQDDRLGTFKAIWTHGQLEEAIANGETPIDIYDGADPLYKVLGAYPLVGEDGSYSLAGGRLDVKVFMPKLKLGPSSGQTGSGQTGKKKPPTDPDLDGPGPHKPDVPGKKGPDPGN